MGVAALVHHVSGDMAFEDFFDHGSRQNSVRGGGGGGGMQTCGRGGKACRCTSLQQPPGL